MFTIWLPFRMPPRIEFSQPNESFECQLEGYPTILSWEDPHWLLEVTDLPSEASARELFQRLCGALQWASVAKGLGVHFEEKVQEIQFFDDPIGAGERIAAIRGVDTSYPVNAHISSHQPAIFPSSKCLETHTAFPIAVIKNPHRKHVVASLEEGLCIPVFDRVFRCPKIGLAVETFRQSRYLERREGQNAKFLSLMTVLEILKPRRKRPPSIESAIKRWICELK